MDTDTEITDRIVAYLTAPVSRIYVLVGIAYGAGIAGLTLTVLPGSLGDDPNRMTVGILLMFLSFGVLFYLSVTILETPGNNDRNSR
jgi:hypothetical protein